MPKLENQKIKMLRILDILRAETDERNPMSSVELIRRLGEEKIECSRKALYNDIALLNKFGYEVMVERGKSNMYYIADRKFSTPELRILLDAVMSAPFITPKKTEALETEICRLAGIHVGEALRQATVQFSTVKQDNEEIFYSIDALQEAIVQQKQVSFAYFGHDHKGEREYGNKGERYVENPIGLIFSGGYYYLVSYSQKHKRLVNFRVDKMSAVAVEETPRAHAKCIKDFASYKEQNLAFGMFGGEPCEVTLLAHNDLANTIIDRFGKTLKRIPSGDSHFLITTNVQISPVFLGWVAMFGGEVKIIRPSHVADKLVQLLEGSILAHKEGQED